MCNVYPFSVYNISIYTAYNLICIYRSYLPFHHAVNVNDLCHSACIFLLLTISVVTTAICFQGWDFYLEPPWFIDWYAAAQIYDTKASANPCVYLYLNMTSVRRAYLEYMPLALPICLYEIYKYMLASQ